MTLYMAWVELLLLGTFEVRVIFHGELGLVMIIGNYRAGDNQRLCGKSV